MSRQLHCKSHCSLYFVKQLKWSCIEPDNLLYFCTTAIRPVTECLPNVALEPHCCTDKGAGVATADGDENCLSWRRLLIVTCHCRSRNVRITMGGVNWAGSISGVSCENCRICTTYYRTNGTQLSLRIYNTPKTFNSLLTKTEKFCKSFLPYCLSHYGWLLTLLDNFVLFCIVS